MFAHIAVAVSISTVKRNNEVTGNENVSVRIQLLSVDGAFFASYIPPYKYFVPNNKRHFVVVFAGSFDFFTFLLLVSLFSVTKHRNCHCHTKQSQ